MFIRESYIKLIFTAVSGAWDPAVAEEADKEDGAAEYQSGAHGNPNTFKPHAARQYPGERQTHNPDAAEIHHRGQCRASDSYKYIVSHNRGGKHRFRPRLDAQYLRAEAADVGDRSHHLHYPRGDNHGDGNL